MYRNISQYSEKNIAIYRNTVFLYRDTPKCQGHLLHCVYELLGMIKTKEFTQLFHTQYAMRGGTLLIRSQCQGHIQWSLLVEIQTTLFLSGHFQILHSDTSKLFILKSSCNIFFSFCPITFKFYTYYSW